MWRGGTVSADTPVPIGVAGPRPPFQRPGWGSPHRCPLDTEVVLPIAAGAVLITLIVVGSVVLVLRPSDTPERKP